MEDEKKKNEMQELHGDFLDTLGVGISEDYKRIIDVVAAIKNINKIEKTSLSKANIKEKTKDRRIRQVLESYDIVEDFENSEAEKIAKQKEEAEEIKERIPGRLDDYVKYLQECKNNGQNVFVVFNGKKLYSCDVTLESAYLEVTGTTKEELEPLQEEFRNAKTDAEKRAVNKKWEALKEKHIQEKIERQQAQSEAKTQEEIVEDESVTENLDEKEAQKRTVRIAQYEQKKNRYTMNKEKTLELLSNNIDGLMEKVQNAKKENSKGKTRGQKFETENIYYDDLIDTLRKYHRYVRTKMKEFVQTNDGQELEEDSIQAESEETKKESTFELAGEEYDEVEPIVIKTPELEVGKEKLHFVPFDDQEAVVELTSEVEVTEESERDVKEENEPEPEVESTSEQPIVPKTNGEGTQNIENTKIKSPAQEYEEKSHFQLDTEVQEIKPKVIAHKKRGKIPEGKHIWLSKDVEARNVEQAEENQTVEQKEETQNTASKVETVQVEETEIVETEANGVTEIVTENIEDSQKLETMEDDSNKAKRTVVKQNSKPQVQYICVQSPQEIKDVRDTKKNESEKGESEDIEQPENNGEPENKPDVTSENTQNIQPNQADNNIQQFDGWASAIVVGANNKDKIEDLLKNNPSTNTVVEKIKDGKININDVKKLLRKKLSEANKSDEKLVDIVEKYLNQRTKNEKQANTKTETSLQKPSLGLRIKNFFKRSFGKNKR